ncbi:MAG: hypothetical protein AAF557_19840 [Pseudomonadota bacterium]
MSIACSLCGIVGAVLLIRSIRRDQDTNPKGAEIAASGKAALPAPPSRDLVAS